MDTRLPLPPDAVLDNTYQIVRTVGTGGFGITYEAIDTSLQVRVAIKEYFPIGFAYRCDQAGVQPTSPRHADTFDWGRANFLEEARTLAQFDHPSIVRVLRVFEVNATAYMVMSFEPGRSLDAWLNELGRTPRQDELDQILDPILGALDVMHAANFLHRDIAPDNIMIRPDGAPVLLDFGAARRAVSTSGRKLTNIVKAGYSPSEQYASDSNLQGPWSDLYALGATLCRAVTGTVPRDASERLVQDDMPRTRVAALGTYRPRFLDAIDACLAVRRSERPQSVAELRALLEEPVTEPIAPPPAAPFEHEHSDLWRPRVLPMALAATVLVACATAAVLYLLQRPRPHQVLAVTAPGISAPVTPRRADDNALPDHGGKPHMPEAPPQEPARPDSNATSPPTRDDLTKQRQAAYDGVWEVTGSGGSGCRVKTWTYRILIQNNKIYVPELPPGSVETDGSFKYKYVAVGWRSIPPGLFTGNLADDAGRGRYSYESACLGSMTLRRL